LEAALVVMKTRRTTGITIDTNAIATIAAIATTRTSTATVLTAPTLGRLIGHGSIGTMQVPVPTRIRMRPLVATVLRGKLVILQETAPPQLSKAATVGQLITCERSMAIMKVRWLAVGIDGRARASAPVTALALRIAPVQVQPRPPHSFFAVLITSPNHCFQATLAQTLSRTATAERAAFSVPVGRASRSL